MKITICVNGTGREVPLRTTLAALDELEDLAQHDGVAVAVNGEVVPRLRWNEREVHNGDDIEIVHAVQGG